MSKPPVKHHYVPICYLKSFCNFQGQMWKRNKERTKATACHPSQICYEPDLYTLQKEETLLLRGITDKHKIEREGFKDHENKFRNIIQQVIKFSKTSRVVEKKDYRLFIEFIVLLKRRNPYIKNHLLSVLPDRIDREFKMDDLRDFLKKMSKEVGDEIDIDKYLENYSSDSLKDPKKLSDIYLSGFIDSDDSIVREVTNDLYKHKQTLLFAATGSSYITSDNPGFTVTDNGVLPFGGFGGPFQFYFPLSPNSCLLIDSLTQEESSILEKTVYPTLINADSVDQINSFTKQLSSKSIFSHSKGVLERV